MSKSERMARSAAKDAAAGRSAGKDRRTSGGRITDRKPSSREGFVIRKDRSGSRAPRVAAKDPGKGERPQKSGRQGMPKDPGYENPNLVIGRNPVTEAIKSGRPIDKILMQKDGEGSVRTIAGLARDNGLQLQYVDKVVLDKLCPGKAHQGVAAYVAAHEYVDIDYIFKAAEKRGEAPLIVLLDGLEDPHNLGAILRSCDGAGAHGVIIPSRRSVSLTDTVAKASAGAIEYVPVAKVSNLASAIDELKKRGVWVAAVDMGGVNYPDAGLTGPLALVIGSEGEGISRLVREKCDLVVGIPMKGRVNSLNASNAAAIVLYEAARQRALKEQGR